MVALGGNESALLELVLDFRPGVALALAERLGDGPKPVVEDEDGPASLLRVEVEEEVPAAVPPVRTFAATVCSFSGSMSRRPPSCGASVSQPNVPLLVVIAVVIGRAARRLPLLGGGLDERTANGTLMRAAARASARSRVAGLRYRLGKQA